MPKIDGLGAVLSCSKTAGEQQSACRPCRTKSCATGSHHPPRQCLAPLPPFPSSATPCYVVLEMVLRQRCWSFAWERQDGCDPSSEVSLSAFHRRAQPRHFAKSILSRFYRIYATSTSKIKCRMIQAFLWDFIPNQYAWAGRLSETNLIEEPSSISDSSWSRRHICWQTLNIVNCTCEV